MLSPTFSRPGIESPIPIEFEDEKTSTLLDLLNKISEEIDDHYDTPQARRVEMRKRELMRAFQQQQQPPTYKEQTFLKQNKPKLQLAEQPQLTRAKTAPEIELNKAAKATENNNNKSNNNGGKQSSKPTNELPLSAATLVKQQQSTKPPAPKAQAPGKAISSTTSGPSGSVKKSTAPQAPPSYTHSNSSKRSDANATGSRHTPFSVEFGYSGRRPGYTGPTANANSFEIDMVDLDDMDTDGEQYFHTNDDNLSEVSSIVNVNPLQPAGGARPKEVRAQLTRGFSIENEKQPKATKQQSSGGIHNSGTSSSNRAPPPPVDRNGKQWM